MKRPRWATVVGVLAVLFGTFGVIAGSQEMSMPSIVAEQQALPTHEPLIGESGAPLMLPDWYQSAALILGVVSMLVAGLYLLSGIALFMLKPFAVRMLYIALGVSVCWAMFKGALFLSAGETLLIMQVPGAAISVIIDTVLAFIAIRGSKKAFVPEVIEEDNYVPKF